MKVFSMLRMHLLASLVLGSMVGGLALADAGGGSAPVAGSNQADFSDACKKYKEAKDAGKTDAQASEAFTAAGGNAQGMDAAQMASLCGSVAVQLRPVEAASGGSTAAASRLTEAQVAERLGVSSPEALDPSIRTAIRSGTLTEAQLGRLDNVDLGDKRGVEMAMSTNAADHRVVQAASELDITPGALDSRIADAARNNTLTNQQMERLQNVSHGDERGIGISMSNDEADRRVAAAAAQMDQGRGISTGQLDQNLEKAIREGRLSPQQQAQVAAVQAGDTAGLQRALTGTPTTQPQGPGGLGGQTPGATPQTQPQRQQQQQNPMGNMGNPLQGMQQGGQGSGQQQQNPFQQQQTCPAGTQLSYVNGQQACINTGLNNTGTQCPVGYTAAYAPNTNTTLVGYGYGTQQQIVCVATGTTGGTCPTGQVASVQSNGTTVCISQNTTDEAKLRDQAGYLDGVRVKDGTCGLGIDSRFSSDSNYLAGYNRGQAECRTSLANGGTGGTGSSKYDVSDARVRNFCPDQLGNVSKDVKDPKGLFTLLFREKGSLSDTEKRTLGFDETLEKRLLKAKNQFDAGKADAVSIRDLDSERKDDPGYREGYACGRKIVESKQ